MNFVHILKRSFTDVNRRTGKKKGADNMQAIMETAFDAVYLITVITLGVLMIFRSRGNRQHLLFGIMAVTLGCGDAFHLIPRAYALCTTGLQDYTFALGGGKDDHLHHNDGVLHSALSCVAASLWQGGKAGHHSRHVSAGRCTDGAVPFPPKWMDKRSAPFELGGLCATFRLPRWEHG